MKRFLVVLVLTVAVSCGTDPLSACFEEVDGSLDCSHQVFLSVDLSDRNLRNIDLSEADLSKATLTEAVLVGADLEGADLEGANLGGANLGGADLGGADLGGADLGGANLGGANLTRANLRGAYLGWANLEGADLWGTILDGANLREANLRGAYLIGADLEGAYLEGADLREADLEGAYLRGAYLRYADLEGANLGGAFADEDTFWPEGFDPVVAGVIFEGAWEDQPDEAGKGLAERNFVSSCVEANDDLPEARAESYCTCVLVNVKAAVSYEEFGEFDDFIDTHRADITAEMLSENFGWFTEAVEACPV